VNLLSATGIRFDSPSEPILNQVSLNVASGEIVTLIGPNGAGKTTLIRILLGLLKPRSGRIERKPGLRLGYMPQKLYIDPLMPLTVTDFLRLAGHDKQRIDRVLSETDIAHLALNPMQHISGGETQRVLLARALLRDPELLVLDEPAQGVDIAGQSQLYAMISRLRDNYGCGILMVSHDLHLVMSTTDNVICLNRHVCCHGHPDTVTTDPAFLALFGEQRPALAVYKHHHDHDHDIHGNIVPAGQGE
jgi:zinc transport system ATP-binding protein